MNFTAQSRQPLTAQEVNYWKMNLSRILKIGAEFEFNLPDKQLGDCKGNNFTCPCKFYGSEEHDCWNKCLNLEKCTKIPNFNRCSTKTDICKPEDCEECTKYVLNCHGLMCSAWASACLTCPDYVVDCMKCEHRYDPDQNPDAIRKKCTRILNPSGSYGVISNTGVHNVTTDGSLLGKKGMEVITTGRRVDYWEFYEMSRKIIETAIKRGAYINERCSIHMHGLASYYGKLPDSGPSPSRVKISELERSLPEVVLANFHQLIRRYQNAITWMTSGLEDKNHLTRWEKFRVSVLNISPLTKSMVQVKEDVAGNAGGNKYGWVNYKFCDFDNNCDVSRLHVEVRVMDGLLSPSAVAAFACLYYSLFIKAVEISRYGVMEVGDKEWIERAVKVKKALMNNCASWEEGNKHGRFSDTSELHKYRNVLIEESYELIGQVKHILSSVGPAYDVLEKMAEAPCSIRRCDGQEWEAIEEQLEVKLTEEGKMEYEIKKIIDTRSITGDHDQVTWVNLVSEELKDMPELGFEDLSLEEVFDRVSNYIEESQSQGEMVWAQKIGSMIKI